MCECRLYECICRLLCRLQKITLLRSDEFRIAINIITRGYDDAVSGVQNALIANLLGVVERHTTARLVAFTRFQTETQIRRWVHRSFPYFRLVRLQPVGSN